MATLRDIVLSTYVADTATLRVGLGVGGWGVEGGIDKVHLHLHIYSI